MNELEELIQDLISKKGGSRKDYRLLMDKIAHHESRSNPTALQIDGGPGRGKYQFETGNHKGGKTAVNRAIRYYKESKKKVPRWLERIGKNSSIDADKLSSNQQDVLYLTNMLGHPKADLGQVVNGKQDAKDFWRKYHWAGAEGDVEARNKSFDESMTTFKPHEPVFTTPASPLKPTPPQIKSLTDFMKDYQVPMMRPPETNQKAMGGLQGSTTQDGFNAFNGGGSHEQNPNGGIPVGVGSNGKPNTVEENETSFKLDSGKFIFSDRIKLDGGGFEQPENNTFATGGPLRVDPTDPVKKKPIIPTLNFNDYLETADGVSRALLKKNIPQPEKAFVEQGPDRSDFETNRESKEPYMKLPRQSNQFMRDFEKDSHSAETVNRFLRVHDKNSGACLGGALDCGTGASSERPDSGFISEKLPGYGSLRGLMNDGNLKKYLSNDKYNPKTGKWGKNGSIDAWEIHQYLRGENLGYDPADGVKLTYSKDGVMPDQVLNGDIKLTIGTILGQAYVNDKSGYRGYDKANPSVKGANRHAVVVIGFDKKDGMPLIYDSGKEVRLDKTKYGLLGKFTKFTTPNRYKDVTHSNIVKREAVYEKDLGYTDDTPMSLNSKWSAIKPIEEGVNENMKSISKYYNVSKSVLTKFAKLLPGLSNKETKLNGMNGYAHEYGIPIQVTDSALGNRVMKPLAKGAGNLFSYMSNMRSDSTSKSDNSKQDWEVEIDAYDIHGLNAVNRNEYINKRIGDNKGSNFKRSSLESSVGAFKIKDLPSYVKTIGYSKKSLYGHRVSTEEELKRGGVAALSLLSEKYNEIKKIHKNLTDDQMVKLAIIGYSNNKKMKSKKFVDYYIRRDTGLSDSNFNKISNFKYDDNGELP